MLDNTGQHEFNLFASEMYYFNFNSGDIKHLPKFFIVFLTLLDLPFFFKVLREDK